MDQNSCISRSENGWTNNKLYIKCMYDCFEPKTKHCLCDDYEILIVDRHISLI